MLQDKLHVFCCPFYLTFRDRTQVYKILKGIVGKSSCFHKTWYLHNVVVVQRRQRNVRATHFLVQFFAVVTRPDVKLSNFTFREEREQREQRERKATIFFFLFWTWIKSFRTQLQKKPRENEKVVKSTEELALFQLHHYTSFNLACRTGAIFSRISALRPCLSLVWKTQKKNVRWAG